MKKFNGKFLTVPTYARQHLKYTVIDNIFDYNESYECIMVKNLNPDFYLLFSFIKLIITETGSPLSHLAICAMDYNISIFLTANITSKIEKNGIVLIENGILLVQDE